MLLPPEAQPLLHALAPVFTNPTYHRFAAVTAAAILTTGRRTIANLLRAVGRLAPGHPASYRRVLSAAEWSGLERGRALARLLLDHLVPGGPVDRVGDDTADGHPGPTVYGTGRHRDAARSSHSYTAWRYGHTRVVLAILVEFPFAARRWALPVLVDLYRTPEVRTAEGVRHRTPAQLMCRLLRLVLIRLPGRVFALAGDSGYGTHAVARFCHRHRTRLTRVSRLPPAAATVARVRLTVAWYGGGARRVEAAAGVGHWYKGGHGLAPVRWVFVKGATGTHRDEYLFTTDTAWPADAVVGTYCGRWSIETTVQECRSCAGLETTRGRSRKTARRAAPCLFGLCSVVAVLYHALPEGKRTGSVSWPGKGTVTFSGAVTAVRRWIWAEGILSRAEADRAVPELPAAVRELSLSGLAPAP